MQLQFNIELQNDDGLIHMANGKDPGRVVVNRFILWVPRLTPKDSMYDKFVTSLLQETQWKYMREMYEVSPPTRNAIKWLFSNYNVKHAFVYLKKSYHNANGHRQNESSLYTMNTF